MEGRIKSQNESVFHNVDRIQEALARRRKITFLYFQYDAAKKKVLQHDGAFYTETPVQLIYADGFYYLVAYNEKHGALAHYRVDRMDKIEVTDQPACRNELVAASTRATWKAMRSACTRASRFPWSFWWRPGAMGAVVDRFGRDVQSVPMDDGAARVRATVMKSPVFFGWLAQFGDRVRILKPQRLARSTPTTFKRSSARTGPSLRAGKALHARADDAQRAAVVEQRDQGEDPSFGVPFELDAAQLPPDRVGAGAQALPHEPLLPFVA